MVSPEASLDAKNQLFTYETLHGQYSIRILWLYPGHVNDPIRCDLSVLDLDSIESRQTYEAISYAWGNVTEMETIICKGKPLSITRALFEALQVFRHSEGDEKRALWADSICINQNDTGERNHQVQLMRRIYTAASKVLIWLGHGDPKAIEASLNLVCQASKRALSQEFKHSGGISVPIQEITDPQYVWREHISSRPVVKTPRQATFTSHEVQVLCPLFDCRWFNRLWVIQELVLSRAAEVFWGLGQIDFMLLGLTAQYIFQYHKPTFLQYNAFAGLKKCCIMQNYWTQTWDEVTFFGMLVLTRRSEASDPRDKVFGMLGLTAHESSGEASAFMEPDYALSTAEVYTYVARKILIEDKDVDLLAAVQHGQSMPDTWISWVPDWTKVSTSYLCNTDRRTSQGCAPHINKSSCPKCDSISLGSTVLISGITVDTVRNLVEDAFNTTAEWTHAELPKSLQAIIEMYKDRYDEKILSFTLSGGYALDGYVVEDATAHIAEYQAFVNWDLERYLADANSLHAPTATDTESTKSAYHFYANCGPTILRRRLFVTSNGMLGLGPLAIEEGDLVVLLFGGSVPFILRPYGDERHYRLVGECYLHDVMDGQAIETWRESGELAFEFHLY